MTDTALVDYDAMLREEAEQKLAEQLQEPTGNRIKILNTKQFESRDGNKAAEIKCIVLAFTWKNQWFKGAYDPNNIVPPDCFAVNAIPGNMVPHRSIENPVHTNCKDCPKNQWGSKGRGKACQNKVILAIIEPDADNNAEIATVELSPTAVNRWNSYVERVRAIHGMHPISVITRLYFDPKPAYATVMFEASEERHTNLPVAMTLRKQAEDLLARDAEDIAESAQKDAA